MTPKNQRRRRCTWCGELIELGKERSSRDAADQLHHFHSNKCWREFLAFATAPPEKW